ncbi:Scavenger receptor cysteine-rich domain superfamily protein [Geodia barretti]|uniref:Scavenger receptor cysteine-rich domain superfamily protein n=1 Tax=Geodia barretti TaxID=519541 RepID=A0AA35TIZ5_GEOBA|nr:Scavenger receptor cysteine-rich domain superfamily protein [Geodia barretti]
MFCGEDEFQCPGDDFGFPRCLPFMYLCDSIEDCVDGFDEQNCNTKLRCPDLENPADGSVVYDGLVVGSQATYSCNDGYRLVGGSTRTCESDGTWSGESPLCSLSGIIIHVTRTCVCVVIMPCVWDLMAVILAHVWMAMLEMVPIVTVNYEALPPLWWHKLLTPNYLCEDGEVRLIKMVGVNERLVEICYNSTWGLVCDDQWGANDTNAQVVCKQYCFESGEKGKMCPNLNDGIFWLDEVNCTGDEGRLDNCTHNNIGEHDCTLAEAVTVVCSSKPFPLFFQYTDIDECAMNISNCMENSMCKNTKGSYYCMCNPGYSCGEDGNCTDIDECECGTHDCDENAICTNTIGSYDCTCREGYIGDGRTCIACNASMGIRLVHGNETSGLVEVHRNNCEWRSVCDDFWTDHDAKVACGQLGFLPYDTDDVEIRLVENTTLYSGIIELRIRDEWRSVCHDKWTDEDAQVACRSLELPSSGKLCNFVLNFCKGASSPTFSRDRVIQKSSVLKKKSDGKFEPGEEVKYWISKILKIANAEKILKIANPEKHQTHLVKSGRQGCSEMCPNLGKRVRVWCRFVGWVSGGLSVTMDGILMLQEFSAGNITCLLKVKNNPMWLLANNFNHWYACTVCL